VCGVKVCLLRLQIIKFLNLPFLDSVRGLTKFLIIMCFIVELVNTKVVDKCMYLASLKIWWHLVKWFRSYSCSKWVSELIALCFVQT
jgi:hypothetical protein